jgi:hypothetical protein
MSTQRRFDAKWTAQSEGSAARSRELDLTTWTDADIETAVDAPGASEATRLAALAEARRRRLPFIMGRDAEDCNDPWNRLFYVETYGEAPPEM